MPGPEVRRGDVRVRVARIQSVRQHHRHRSKLELLIGDRSLPGHGLPETLPRSRLHEERAMMARAAARAKLATALLGEIET